MRALLLGGGAAAALVLVPASPASAHSVGPTDVRTAIASITPPTRKLEVSIDRAGQLVSLHVLPGSTATVEGYEGEPYLRVAADGSVEENLRSPATYLNETRLGTTPVPASADAKADPVWRRVGGDGAYRWHDHRTHWMAAGVPPRPVDWTIPIVVDGQRVVVAGRYDAVPAPSALPWLALLLVTAALTALVGWRHPRFTALAVLVAGLVCLPVSLALLRVPGAGLNEWVGLGLCAIGVAAPATALVRRHRTPSGLFVAAAGLSLAIWAGLRTDVLGHAVLVTTLPGWLDRLSVTLGLGVGLAAVVVGHAGALRAPASRGRPEAEPQPATARG